MKRPSEVVKRGKNVADGEARAASQCDGVASRAALGVGSCCKGTATAKARSHPDAVRGCDGRFIFQNCWLGWAMFSFLCRLRRLGGWTLAGLLESGRVTGRTTLQEVAFLLPWVSAFWKEFATCYI